MKTLYVSDLDSTLLNSKAQLSPFTIQTLNTLTKRGLKFSFATARSAVTATAVTKGLEGDTPIIVYTGTFMVDRHSRERIVSNFMTQEEIDTVKRAVEKFSFIPIVYAFVKGEEKFIYDPSAVSENVLRFVKTREEDSRRTQVKGGFEGSLMGDVFYFSYMEQKAQLLPVYEFLKDKCNCLFQPDNYTDNWFLEVMPRAATKANAALKLKELTGADKLVVFGDGYNDMDMFKGADEAYAVSNAVEELKTLATGVIDSCDEDGVAKWLLANFDD